MVFKMGSLRIEPFDLRSEAVTVWTEPGYVVRRTVWAVRGGGHVGVS